MVDTTVLVPKVLRLKSLEQRSDLFPLADILAGRRPEQEVIIEILPPPEALIYLREWADELTHLGWEILETTPHLRLRVTEKASATSALPHQSDEATS